MSARTVGIIMVAGTVLLVAGSGENATGATTRTWNGSTDTVWTNGANWVGGVAPQFGYPPDSASFIENSPGNRTPALTADLTLSNVGFTDSVGWTVSGGSSRLLVLRQVNSSGSGINTFDVKVKVTEGLSHTWTLGPGTTVSMNHEMRYFAYSALATLTITGGGALHTAAPILISSNRQIDLSNSVLRVAAATPVSDNGSAVHITGASSKVQLLTTIENAQALIGDDIIDDVGDGLRVRSIGGGYVEVDVDPEPAGTVITVR